MGADVTLNMQILYQLCSQWWIGQVLDYSQYYLDLAVANTKGEAAEWQLEYNLTYYYGLTEVTSVSLHDLADRFSNAEDQYFGR